MKTKKIIEWITAGFFLVIIIVIIKGCFFSNPLESNISSDDIEKCKEATNDDDFENAHKYLTKILNKYEKSNIWDRTVSRNQVIAATGRVYEKETNYLFAQGKEEYYRRALLLLTEFPIYGEAVSEDMEVGDKVNKFDEYIAWCAKHNELCNHALDLAIVCHNKEIAQEIVFMFKPMPSTKTGDDGDYAIYSEASKNKAQSKVDEMTVETESDD